MKGLSKLGGLRLRRRQVPAVNAKGVLQVGSASFRRNCAIHKDGTYHVAAEASAAVWEEYRELSVRWQLPAVRARKAATPAGIELLHGVGGKAPARVFDEKDLEAGARRFMSVLREAAAAHASDIKLYVRQTHGSLRIKLGDAEYTHGEPWPVSEAKAAIAWVYDERAKGDGSASQQSGVFQSFMINETSRIERPEGVAGLRGQKGFHSDNRDFLVLRILYTREGENAGSLEELGFDAEVLEALAEERQSDNGLMIIGGSTGDGKSTTLVRQLERLYEERDGNLSIYSVEDPVEYSMVKEGICQLAVSTAATGEERGRKFAEALRAFVRCNPDVGMVMEIRSIDDARDILQFVVSGHKIFTTIHSSSANAVLFRLIRLGIDPRELSEPGVVSLVMRQRLVPVLCPDCAIRPIGAMAARIADWTGVKDGRPMLRNRAGCATCQKGREGAVAQKAWGGLSRRQAVGEIIRVDDRYRQFVEARDGRGAWHYWTAPRAKGGMGGRTVEEKVRDLVARGLVDYSDVSHDHLPGAALREVRG